MFLRYGDIFDIFRIPVGVAPARICSFPLQVILSFGRVGELSALIGEEFFESGVGELCASARVGPCVIDHQSHRV